MSTDSPHKTRTKGFKSNWELEQRIFCVEHYFRSGSFKQVHNLFCKQFNTDTVPHKTCIQKWVIKFRKYGTLSNLSSAIELNSSGNSEDKKMSSQKGNAKRSRAQKHQNSSVFKNDLHDKTNKIKFLNSLEINDVCGRCKAILEWKIKYKKYKVLKNPSTCVKCKGKTVTKSYRTICQPCAKTNKLCPKCAKPEAEWIQDSELVPADFLPASNDDGEEKVKDDGENDEDWKGW